MKQLSAKASQSLSKTFKVKASREPSWIRHRSGREPMIPTKVSGVQVPQLANQKNAKVVMQLVELFTKKREAIGMMSYAVYLVPGIALLCGLLLTRFGEKRPIAIGTAALCAAIAGAGFWKLLTTDTKALFAIAIGPGLWLSLWAYVGLALVAVASALPEQFRGQLSRVTRRAKPV